MSNSDEWETPLVFFDKLNDEFNFGLDLFSLASPVARIFGIYPFFYRYEHRF